MATQQLDLDGLLALADPEIHATLRRIISRAHARGDGIAVYENKSLDHSQGGRRVFMTFGSKDAQIESAEPPGRMPDVGIVPSPWAYLLVGCCLTAVLPSPPDSGLYPHRTQCVRCSAYLGAQNPSLVCTNCRSSETT